MICGKAEMACRKEKHQYTESGLDNIYLDNVEYCRCPTCGEESVHIPSMANLHRLIGFCLIQKRSLLSGKEIRFLRKNLGLKANEIADIMGVDIATVSRWESGKQPMSKPNDRFFRLVYSGIKGLSGEKVRHLIRDCFKEIDSENEGQEWTIPLNEWSGSIPFNPILTPNNTETKTAGG
ncbi:MAG: type II TA system antitoxin MqsA family protein [Desulfococcaceae bacterium]